MIITDFNEFFFQEAVLTFKSKNIVWKIDTFKFLRLLRPHPLPDASQRPLGGEIRLTKP